MFYLLVGCISWYYPLINQHICKFCYSSFEVLDYAGNLKPKELFDWLKSMETKIEWKPMIEEKKVKFACTKLKGHAMIWWDHVQKDRTKKENDKIKT